MTVSTEYLFSGVCPRCSNRGKFQLRTNYAGSRQVEVGHYLGKRYLTSCYLFSVGKALMPIEEKREKTIYDSLNKEFKVKSE